MFAIGFFQREWRKQNVLNNRGLLAAQKNKTCRKQLMT